MLLSSEQWVDTYLELIGSEGRSPGTSPNCNGRLRLLLLRDGIPPGTLDPDGNAVVPRDYSRAPYTAAELNIFEDHRVAREHALHRQAQDRGFGNEIYVFTKNHSRDNSCIKNPTGFIPYNGPQAAYMGMVAPKDDKPYHLREIPGYVTIMINDEPCIIHGVWFCESYSDNVIVPFTLILRLKKGLPLTTIVDQPVIAAIRSFASDVGSTEVLAFLQPHTEATTGVTKGELFSRSGASNRRDVVGSLSAPLAALSMLPHTCALPVHVGAHASAFALAPPWLTVVAIFATLSLLMMVMIHGQDNRFTASSDIVAAAADSDLDGSMDTDPHGYHSSEDYSDTWVDLFAADKTPRIRLSYDLHEHSHLNADCEDIVRVLEPPEPAQLGLPPLSEDLDWATFRLRLTPTSFWFLPVIFSFDSIFEENVLCMYETTSCDVFVCLTVPPPTITIHNEVYVLDVIPSDSGGRPSLFLHLPLVKPPIWFTVNVLVFEDRTLLPGTCFDMVWPGANAAPPGGFVDPPWLPQLAATIFNGVTTSG
ncbi:hypothetical protein T484DRAFT_1861692 [Baffinella frigidus]|nr:hypothetical protein T484DRAFT_1861692 [Cryptophyta sp. CCMP2293]